MDVGLEPAPAADYQRAKTVGAPPPYNKIRSCALQYGIDDL